MSTRPGPPARSAVTVPDLSVHTLGPQGWAPPALWLLAAPADTGHHFLGPSFVPSRPQLTPSSASPRGWGF